MNMKDCLKNVIGKPIVPYQSGSGILIELYKEGERRIKSVEDEVIVLDNGDIYSILHITGIISI
jgi:hypothetical protein